MIMESGSHLMVVVKQLHACNEKDKGATLDILWSPFAVILKLHLYITCHMLYTSMSKHSCEIGINGE